MSERDKNPPTGSDQLRSNAADLSRSLTTVRKWLKEIKAEREAWAGAIFVDEEFPPLAALDLIEQQARETEAERDRWLAWSDGDYPDDSPGDVIAAEPDGTITLDDAITTWNPKRAAAFFKAENVRLARQVADLEALGRELVANADKEKMVRREDVEALRAALAAARSRDPQEGA